MTPAASCFISTRQQHHIQTLPVHQDLIGWVQSGSKTVIQGQQQQTFCSGQLFLLARGQTWDVVNQPDNGAYQALAIQLDPDFVLAFHQRYGSHLQTTTIHSHARLAITPLLAQALNSSHQLLNSTEHSALLQQHRLEEVLLLLAEQGYSFASDAVWTLADKVRQRISLSPHDDWTIERLAHLFHTSASTLRRRIAESGATLGDIIREVRLETGLNLLQTTALTVGEIAARCGYDSHSRFSAAFKQRFGFAPSLLRSHEQPGASPFLSITA